MCIRIDPTITSLNKRVVWKVFQRQSGMITSLFCQAVYPKGKPVVRSEGITSITLRDKSTIAVHGLYVYTSKAAALKEASAWLYSYIAKLSVKPEDFLHANGEGAATYRRATRTGNFINTLRGLTQ